VNVKQDSATGRALKTAAQAFIGFIIGLVVVVWNVQGVPHAVFDYLKANMGSALLTIGLPTAIASGMTSFFWNAVRKDVPLK
jgi:uncharacterized membrane protein YGL010W